MVELFLGLRDVGSLTVFNAYSAVFGYSGYPIVYPLKTKPEQYEKAKDEFVTERAKNVGSEQLSYLKLASTQEAFEFPLGAIIEVDTSNKVIKRFAQRSAGRGSVKEIWQDDDYRIKIKALLLEDKYPEDLVKAAKIILSIKESLEVTCPYLRIFDVTNLVVENYKFSEPQVGLQALEINCVSDVDIDLLEEKA